MIEGAAIVLQARMGSSRLPGKAMAFLADRSVLAHCLDRLRATSDIRVVLATTTREEDDCVEEEGRRLGVTVVRGPDLDVLGRFVMVAAALSLTDVVRATGDNPAVDMDAPRRMLELRRRTGADHVIEYGLPYGTAVEAVSVEALTRAASLTDDAYDREHVTAFIRRDPRFAALRAIGPASVRRPELRLTIDTAEDLDRVRKVFALVEPGLPHPVPLTALIAAAERLTPAVPDLTGSDTRDIR